MSLFVKRRNRKGFATFTFGYTVMFISTYLLSIGIINITRSPETAVPFPYN